MQKSYRIPQLHFYKGTHTAYKLHPSTYNLHVHKYTTSREFSIQNPVLHAEDKELFEYYYYIQRAKRPSVQKRNSTHRRQGDLLEIHPCDLQDIPGIQPQDLPKASSYLQTFQSFQTFQTFQSFQSFQTFQTLQRHFGHSSQPLQAILQVPVSPGIPTHSSILQLECIFYIFYVFYKFYSSIGFHRKLHRVPVEQLQTFYKHSFFKEREML